MSSPTRSPARPHDPDFDAPPPPRRSVAPADPSSYQRLVANPFLALLALVACLALSRFALREKALGLLILAQMFPVAAYFLLQYHCRDCGATGRLSRWREHECEAVRERRRRHRPRRFRGPNPKTQLLLWIYALISAAFVAIFAR